MQKPETKNQRWVRLQREAGLVPLQVWVPRALVSAARAAVQKLIGEPKK